MASASPAMTGPDGPRRSAELARRRQPGPNDARAAQRSLPRESANAKRISASLVGQVWIWGAAGIQCHVDGRALQRNMPAKCVELYSDNSPAPRLKRLTDMPSGTPEARVKDRAQPCETKPVKTEARRSSCDDEKAPADLSTLICLRVPPDTSYQSQAPHTRQRSRQRAGGQTTKTEAPCRSCPGNLFPAQLSRSTPQETH